MPVELNIVEAVTELDTTVVTVVLESASEPGPAGPGVPTGGTAGQVLTKDSGTDYDTSWQDATGGPGSVDAEDVTFTPAGTISASDVQAAVEEVASDAATALSTHESDTTNVHGIADTSALALSANVPSNATFNDHSARHENGGADEINIGGLDGTPAELTNHLNDTSAAHAASAISADSTTLVGTGTDVQAVLEELDNGIADHLADSSAAHAASAISFTPNGSIAATDVQAAIQEVRDEAGGGGAPTDATYITQTANGTLSNEQALSALSTGLVKVTTTTGVLSTAVANTDYPAVTHATRHENGGADEISLAGLSGEPADTVNKSLYDANTVLKADSDNTPAALTMGASTILARLAAGSIVAATTSEIRTLLDVPTNAEAVLDSLVDAKGDLLAGTADNTIARVAVGATNGMVLEVASGQTPGIQWDLPSGWEYDYVERTTNLTVNATTTAGANTLITGTSVTYTAVPILIEVFLSQVQPGADGGIGVVIYDGSTELGILGFMSSIGSTTSTDTLVVPFYGAWRITPTAASHQYGVRCYRNAVDGTVVSGAGTSGAAMPSFIRVTKV